MNLPFTPGYNAAQISFRLGNRSYRDGALGLQKESDQIIRSELKQEERFYMNNRQEIVNKRTWNTLDRVLEDKNSLARPWYDSGAGEGLMLDDKNDEAVIKTSRTTKLAMDNSLQPAPNKQAAQATQRSILTLLQERRDARRRLKRTTV
jgi:hypothetical protein